MNPKTFAKDHTPNTALSQLSNDDSFDVVVIGAGGAGMSSALFATLKGARVLLVESTEYVGGTTALSAGTSWVPGTDKGLKVEPRDTLERAKTFLNNAVGERAEQALRDAFVDNGAKAIALLEAQTDVQYQVRALHPDYLSELEGSVLRGRAIEPIPFDGRQLGGALKLIRPPIPEFTVLGGMMVDRDDIANLLKLTQSWSAFVYSARIILRHGMDKLLWGRGTRLVMGNALIARLLYSLMQRNATIVTQTKVENIVKKGDAVHSVCSARAMSNARCASKAVW